MTSVTNAGRETGLLSPERPLKEGLQIQVLGLAGHVCTLLAEWSWTVQQVHDTIFHATGIHPKEQHLFFGIKRLAPGWAGLKEVPLLAELEEIPKSIEVTLVRQMIIEPGAVAKAIRKGDSLLALELLALPNVKDLNDTDRFGQTILHYAANREMTQVCLAILKRKDFHKVNTADAQGATALHLAATNGLAEVCRALMKHREFTAYYVQDCFGKTAADWAKEVPHQETLKAIEEMMLLFA